jgi:hypothetical protein
MLLPILISVSVAPVSYFFWANARHFAQFPALAGKLPDTSTAILRSVSRRCRDFAPATTLTCQGSAG